MSSRAPSLRLRVPGATTPSCARRRASTPRPSAQGGFTLLEMLIALGILAFGATVALGLLTLATQTHRRAVDRTQSALLADALLADVRGGITFAFDHRDLERVEDTEQTYYVQQAGSRADYPDYTYDVLLTPLDAVDPGGEPDAFHLEVVIRWMERGQIRGAHYHTVVLRRLTARDLAPAAGHR